MVTDTATVAAAKQFMMWRRERIILISVPGV